MSLMSYFTVITVWSSCNSCTCCGKTTWLGLWYIAVYVWGCQLECLSVSVHEHCFISPGVALFFVICYSYVAAKTCYFGVGGGSRDFAAYVQQCNVFNVEVVHSVTSGFVLFRLVPIMFLLHCLSRFDLLLLMSVNVTLYFSTHIKNAKFIWEVYYVHVDLLYICGNCKIYM